MDSHGIDGTVGMGWSHVGVVLILDLKDRFLGRTVFVFLFKAQKWLGH